jgi:hypothetical protein
MDRFTKLLLAAALAVAIVALIAFWPGKYQYYNTHDGVLMRVNRYTGATEYYMITQGWQTSKPVRISDTLEDATPENPFDKANRETQKASPSPTPGK